MRALDRRIGLLFGGFILLLAIASARAAWLGIFNSGPLQRFASSQQIDNKVVPAMRGVVTDRSGQVLALSESTATIIADPYLIHDAPTVAAKLGPLLGSSQKQLTAQLSKPHTGYVKLAENVPSTTATKIMGLHIDGINQSPGLHRTYPLGSTAGQVLGWVGADGKGQSGIEYTMNQILKGKAGLRRIVNDGNQQAISIQDAKTMQPGAKIGLTLDTPLQQEVEHVLAQTAAQFNPKSATAIVVNPNNDRILADANWPFLDPNNLGASSPEAQGNQSVGFAYEPGSTFKAFTIAGALQDGAVKPNTMINEPPDLAPYGYVIKDAEAHGDVSYSVAHVLAVSSNIGADLIAQRDGPNKGANRFNYWVHKFGFGQPTGVPLNGESNGVIPPLSKYSGISMYNLPFGQGQEVTPMQMVQAYAAIADGGVMRKPQLIQSVGNKQRGPAKGQRVISAKVASQLRGMMRGVLGDGGTASGAQIPGYDLAGKTGTAQVAVNGKYSSSKYVASFIGMVPASHPKLEVAVVVNQPSTGEYGGTVAGPAFQKIVGWAVPHFGINPCPKPCPASAYAQAAPSTP
ncbi:MAG: penicillin-binding protein 2 [Solirubrobacterales bacterium]|nr:penicillin-binding protein 2 [Solirubrobacterales bacterium]